MASISLNPPLLPVRFDHQYQLNKSPSNSISECDSESDLDDDEDNIPIPSLKISSSPSSPPSDSASSISQSNQSLSDTTTSSDKKLFSKSEIKPISPNVSGVSLLYADTAPLSAWKPQLDPWMKRYHMSQLKDIVRASSPPPVYSCLENHWSANLLKARQALELASIKARSNSVFSKYNGVNIDDVDNNNDEFSHDNSTSTCDLSTPHNNNPTNNNPLKGSTNNNSHSSSARLDNESAIILEDEEPEGDYHVLDSGLSRTVSSTARRRSHVGAHNNNKLSAPTTKQSNRSSTQQRRKSSNSAGRESLVSIRESTMPYNTNPTPTNGDGFMLTAFQLNSYKSGGGNAASRRRSSSANSPPYDSALMLPPHNSVESTTPEGQFFNGKDGEQYVQKKSNQKKVPYQPPSPPTSPNSFGRKMSNGSAVPNPNGNQNSVRGYSSSIPSAQTITFHSKRRCISCGSDQSPCWRPSWSAAAGQLCNSCGLRYKKTNARCLNKSCGRIPAKGEWDAIKIAAVRESDGELHYRCFYCDGEIEVNKPG